MRTIRQAKLDNMLLRLVERNNSLTGVIFVDGGLNLQIDGGSADDIWRRLHDEAGKAKPKYFGFDGARARFSYWFKDGFQSSEYLNRERNYKVAAKEKLDAIVPLEKAVTGSGYGDAVLSIYRATNLLSLFEKTRLQDVLRGAAADDFINAAARFAMGEGMPALVALRRVLRPHGRSPPTFHFFGGPSNTCF